jgi:hypothetical protein
MKYLGVIAFVAALTWTWNIIHSDSPVSFETHSGIQERLASLIENTIKAKRPTASEVQIEKIWTELLSPGKVKAFFIYTFKDSEGEPSRTTIKGEGLLERQAADSSGLDHWMLTKVKTTSDAIVFEEGLVVTPKSSVEEK